jgi:hypothetical protein
MRYVIIAHWEGRFDVIDTFSVAWNRSVARYCSKESASFVCAALNTFHAFQSKQLQTLSN